jgi:CheY-like chemotaxis protein
VNENIFRSEVTILIAEDDDGHAELVTEQLREAGIGNPIQRFVNGQEVWNFLTRSGSGPHREQQKPYLLLLDIRMPRMDGIEVLRKVKADPVLQTMPVIMLTTTNDPREVQACYDAGCNSYVTKPVQYTQFTEAIKRLGLFITIMQVVTLKGEC